MAQINENFFERCCRLCAEEQDVTVMIFSAEAEAMLLQNKLNKYLLIEVEKHDKLPKNICIKCCSKLQTVCDFIDSVHKAQELLTSRSLMLDQSVTMNDCSITPVKVEQNFDTVNSDDETKITEMEVSVDPMMVLQNSEEGLSPLPYDHCSTMEDVTHLHDVDGENVTIKLIKKSDASPTNNDEKDDTTKPFPCNTCQRSYYTELALRNHSWVHIDNNKDNKYKCQTCFESFDYKSDLINHLKQHKSVGSCQLCGRMFRSEKTYTDHMSVHATAGMSFPCKICGRSYKTWGSLRTHSITHSSERPYHCPVCKKSFKRNQDLKFHLNQHTGARPYQCPFCDKSFASSGNCYSHRNRMHPGRRVNREEGKVRRRPCPKDIQIQIQPKPATKSVMTFVNGIYKYQCQLCEHSFLRRDNYTYHMYQHTGEKPFQCSFCQDKFVTRKGLLIHHDKMHPHQDRPLALLSKNALLK